MWWLRRQKSRNGGAQGPQYVAPNIRNNNVWGEGRLDVFETVSAIIFMDGFESGDTSAWSMAVP